MSPRVAQRWSAESGWRGGPCAGGFVRVVCVFLVQVAASTTRYFCILLCMLPLNLIHLVHTRTAIVPTTFSTFSHHRPHRKPESETVSIIITLLCPVSLLDGCLDALLALLEVCWSCTSHFRGFLEQSRTMKAKLSCFCVFLRASSQKSQSTGSDTAQRYHGLTSPRPYAIAARRTSSPLH